MVMNWFWRRMWPIFYFTYPQMVKVQYIKNAAIKNILSSGILPRFLFGSLF